MNLIEHQNEGSSEPGIPKPRKTPEKTENLRPDSFTPMVSELAEQMSLQRV